MSKPTEITILIRTSSGKSLEGLVTAIDQATLHVVDCPVPGDSGRILEFDIHYSRPGDEIIRGTGALVEGDQSGLKLVIQKMSLASYRRLRALTRPGHPPIPKGA